ncbi:MAG: hypothetical protein Unbinned6284contig1004_12 [Prokaryotic dsDNA virus sp.]|nr:MAG: hypothetical protein Unbinned6284contig1004_12 [Prokaryotic dsDNA virus sp.]|tara:strand:+ start:28011 stop:28265 length:255 start_codon:yes stop_codon:yes gene_type:complete
MKVEISEVLGASATVKNVGVGTAGFSLQAMLTNINLIISLLVGVATFAYMFFSGLNAYHAFQTEKKIRKSKIKKDNKSASNKKV